MGADANSSFLYMKSKGLTERGLAQLGYADTIIFRAGFLKGAQRPDSRRIMDSMISVMSGVASCFSPNAEIEIPLLAKAMAKAGSLGSSGIPADVGATRVDVGADANANAWFTALTNKAAVLLGGK